MSQDLADARTAPAPETDFADPYVDVDEERTHPLPHRYVHGGFRGTLTRFSIYLPPAKDYRGRFFQHITPVPDSENLGPLPTGAANPIACAFAAGAYYLETNGGGQTHTPGSTVDPLVGAYLANAACAQYSRHVAAGVYGDHRPYGYAYGGSGGGFRTIGSAENTAEVWDGFVPYVIGSPVAAPNCFTVRMHALRVLRGAFEGIVDALEPGGSGDPYAHLSPAQADALREVTAMGFPPQSWYAHDDLDLHGFAALFSGLAHIDPTYFTDFWQVPGYLGADDPESLAADLVRVETEVERLLTAADLAHGDHGPLAGQGRGGVDDAFLGSVTGQLPVAVRLAQGVGQLVGAELVVRTGRAAGERFGLSTVQDRLATFTPHNSAVLADLRAGDEVVVDNSRFLAAQTYHRHQDPGPQYPVWDQFRRADGTPRYPQRPVLVGPIFTAGAAGTVPTGTYTGKMVVVASLWDREAYPWQPDWYRQRVQEAAQRDGADGDDRFRLYYVDHAVHADDESRDSAVHTVSYLGVLHQALCDLARWVEDGVAPPPSTSYEVVDGQVLVPDGAHARAGLQPVARLDVEGHRRRDAVVGEDVTVRLHAQMPEGPGALVAVEWDLDGDGGYGPPQLIEPAPVLSVDQRVSFAAPGTYFVTVRVTAQRKGDAAAVHTCVQNLDRVRIVVS